MAVRLLALSGLFLIPLLGIVLGATDYYELLGISNDADSREIRKAFKKLALAIHPDKNPDDPAAQEKFVQIKKAYEVLKDQEKRKQYDLNGEAGVQDGFKNSRDFQSWNYYHSQFGIYDDDPEIITLTGSDFGNVVYKCQNIVF